MGEKGERTRARMIDATRDLVEGGGYFGTGLAQVLKASGAPRGSLYFHFPGGKDELVAESLTRAGAEIGRLMEDLLADAPSLAEGVARLLDALGERLTGSGWRKGCPVATVALETAADNDALQQVCSRVYAAWEGTLRDRLAAEGRPDPAGTALTVLAMVEGALLLARAHRDRAPLDAVARSVAALV
ncbi:TetR/AcrR family transcriptional regulator [Streptomyces sp. 4N509B]|uniref:TetR/AcrR family transcriptional regulator n=1 Tax=Streptomyces sp. 4N509B TaxID=3457413 RepID=UPI003FD0D53C